MQEAKRELLDEAQSMLALVTHQTHSASLI